MKISPTKFLLSRKIRCPTISTDPEYIIKKSINLSNDTLLVGSDGFEPPKLEAADLQSAPFGHSGNYP